MESLESRRLLTALVSGQTVAGNIAVATQLDQYEFSAANGNAVIVDVSSTSGIFGFSAQADLYRPDGMLVQSFQGIFTLQPVTLSGVYTLIVHDDNSFETGKYGLTLVKAPGAQNTNGDAGPLVSGQTRSAGISNGNLDAHTITAAIGDTFVAALSSTGGVFGFSPQFELYGPDGTQLAVGQNFVRLNHVAKAGTYYFVAHDDNGFEAGTYNITVAKLPGSQNADGDGGPIGSGATRAGTMAAGDLDVNTISASVGDSLSVALGSNGGVFGFSPQFDVYGPTGASLTQDQTFVRLNNLSLSGTYYIVAHDDNGYETGTYGLTVVRVPGSQSVDGDAGQLAANQTKAANIAHGDLDSFTFLAVSGDIFAASIASTSGEFGFNPVFDLYDPSGALLKNDLSSTTPITLAKTGTFYLVAHDDNGYESGAYNVTMGLVTGPTKSVVSVATTDATAAEPGTDTGKVTFTRSNVRAVPLTVAYSISGTATNGTDYVQLSGTIVIPANAASASVIVKPINDAVAEPTQSVVLGIKTDLSYKVDPVNKSANVSIADNDAVFGSIAGTIYSDPNANGKFDTGEKGLASVKVYLDANKNGAFDTGEKTTTTDASGFYRFSALAAGTYRVREVVPTNYALIAPAAGFYDVAVATGAVIGKNFFDALATASIAGRVFGDSNGNGVRDVGEVGLGLWQIYIDKNNNAKLDTGEKSILTDINGYWSFKGLVAGTYVVRVVPVSGITTTKPTGGVQTVVLTAGQAATGKLFGERSIT